MENIRINICDLILVAKALHEFKVVAAGALYATIECDANMCMELSKRKIQWSMD